MKRLLLICAVSGLGLLGACSAEIGDECGYDIDCSANGDRNCDRTQPDGYCLIIGCDPDDCPGEAVCVEFSATCPTGTAEATCELVRPNRGRTYCLRHCDADGDCRGGYRCADPDELNAEVIDYTPEGEGVCVPEV